MNAQETYEVWLSKLSPSDPMHGELEEIRGNEAEITDRFYQEIVFGTAGLRGICGAGTNRMNELTVGRATQGIANYILKSGEDASRGVVIAYDCRYHSREFSELAAEILAGNGIKAYLFPSLRPTPELSFAIRKLGTVSGINMTASHNPKEYNGYKVYWEDGAQISGEVSDGMLKEIQALDLFKPVQKISLSEAVDRGLIQMLGEDMDEEYMSYVLGMALRPDDQLDLSVPVVYTPLNGAGSLPMRDMAKRRGFVNFTIVPEQQDPDPDFTTVPFPNPENPKAFELAEKLGRERGAEVLIATDPDSDRMAVEIADGRGGYRALNGNQTGALLIAYKAMAMTENGTMPDKPVMIKSIVTGNFGRAICEDYGIDVYEALTGFKNICGRIPELEAKGYHYFFGYEESIGCAPGEAVRDKDGITAGMLITEMAAYYRKQGMSMAEALDSLYKKYGYFAEDQVSVVLKGQAGQERIGRIMDAFRKGQPQSFGEFKVAEIIDYIDGWEDIPAQNALKFQMTDGSWFAMRPSGTEPKIKFYYYARTDAADLSKAKVEGMVQAVNTLIEQVQ
jgi:phosphoglucomutase